MHLSNVTITGNSASKGGGINGSSSVIFDSINRCNIYLNHANQGNDLYGSSEVVVDTFTVVSPTEFFASPIEYFSFDILNGFTEIEQVEADLYVSPAGDNTNSGLTEEVPLKTIGHALSKILADSLHPHTIYLLEGIYSHSSNEELFPIYLMDNISLSGESQSEVILDAEGQSMVIIVDSRKGVMVSNLTITGGSGANCGGLFCAKTDLTLENVNILNNSALEYGGAICFIQSHPTILNTIITGNHGYGIYCFLSSPFLTNVTISNNLTSSIHYAGYAGGGIFCDGSHPVLINSILWNDSTAEIVFCDWYSPASAVTIKHSDIQGGEEGIGTNNGTVNWLEGNLDEDPLFILSGDYPYALSDESPCVNSGTPDTTGLNLPELDLAGNPRIYGGIIDMGAYENQSVSIFITQNLLTDKFEFFSSPNPFSNELIITYKLPESAYTKIDIYNSAGEKIKELLSKLLYEGKHEQTWNATYLPPGIYFIRLQVGKEILTKKMIKI
jgi:hypothetical protein